MAARKKQATGSLSRIREIALSLEGAVEALNHSHPCFTVKEKTFVMYMNNHHGKNGETIWCKAPPGDQADMVEADPVRFFVPPYVGPRGWIGVRLDVGKVDWAMVRTIVTESYRMTTRPKKKKSVQ